MDSWDPYDADVSKAQSVGMEDMDGMDGQHVSKEFASHALGVDF